jgi:hypothetical protein
MFANRLATPFALLALFFLYLAWKVDYTWSWGIIPFVVITAIIVIFGQEINWWWYNRNTPELEPELTKLLGKRHIFYQNLQEADKKRFRDRVVLIRMGTDWMPLGWGEDAERLPPDVELALCAQHAMLTLHRDDFLLEQFEKIIVYPKPFPTPEHPYPHASERYVEDGCLIFSAEHVMAAFLSGVTYFNVALYEYARAYLHTYPDEHWPVFLDTEAVRADLQQISGFSKEQVESATGIIGAELLAVAIHHYFCYPVQFQGVLNPEFVIFGRIFGPK